MFLALVRPLVTPHSTETLILGAGYAGLAAAALLAAEGRGVTVLEAHDTLGGCASFFKTGPYTFDVGATTFSAVRPDRPAGRVFAHLGIEPAFERVDPGMVIRMPHADVVRHASIDSWIHEAQQHFSGDQPGFWKQLYHLEEQVWSLIDGKSYIPPVTMRDWLRMVDPRNLASLPLLPGLVRPVRHLMQQYATDSDPRFQRFVDEQLLISTQNNAAGAPYLTGAMGLTYPSETYYPVGGMVRPAILLLRSITQNGGTVKFRRAVTSIERHDRRWRVTCANGDVYDAATVVSSIPIWNMASLLSGDADQGPARWFQKHAERFPRVWSALTLYFALDGVPSVASPYVQLHLDEPLPWVHSDSLFLTISRPGDTQKAPVGHCTVTVSTHARIDDWQGLSPEEHAERKAIMTRAMVAYIKRRMHEFDGMQWIHEDAGTPWTWVKYTHRHHGFVGGLPHATRQPLLTLPPNQTPFPGLYHIGDTAFPGQGTPAVMLGAWNTVERILS